MTPIVVLALLAAVAMLIGLFRNRLPWNVVRFGYILGFGTPVLGLLYAIWQLWHQWVSWREIASS